MRYSVKEWRRGGEETEGESAAAASYAVIGSDDEALQPQAWSQWDQQHGRRKETPVSCLILDSRDSRNPVHLSMS